MNLLNMQNRAQFMNFMRKLNKVCDLSGGWKSTANAKFQHNLSKIYPKLCWAKKNKGHWV